MDEAGGRVRPGARIDRCLCRSSGRARLLRHQGAGQGPPHGGGAGRHACSFTPLDCGLSPVPRHSGERRDKHVLPAGPGPGDGGRRPRQQHHPAHRRELLPVSLRQDDAPDSRRRVRRPHQTAHLLARPYRVPQQLPLDIVLRLASGCRAGHIPHDGRRSPLPAAAPLLRNRDLSRPLLLVPRRLIGDRSFREHEEHAGSLSASGIHQSWPEPVDRSCSRPCREE